MTERKLVTIRTVKEVHPIPGADRIEQLIVDGWSLVSGKGNFKAGQYCVFFEPDSFVDVTKPQFQFLEKNKISWNGKEGARIKTIRLKGVVSQGLALPVSDFPEIYQMMCDAGSDCDPDYSEMDFSEQLGVLKWEKYSGSLPGTRKGNFPWNIPKTDSERLQNLWDYIDRDIKYEVTAKMDGSSLTCYLNSEGVFGVCSRNQELLETEDNLFWKCVRLHNVEEKLRKIGNEGWAVQGELVGPGVQGNRHKLDKLHFKVFNIFDIKQQYYVEPTLVAEWCEKVGLEHVPILEYRKFDFKMIDEAVAYAENIQNGEGVVFKKLNSKSVLATGRKESPHLFKIISPSYLIKWDE